MGSVRLQPLSSSQQASGKAHRSAIAAAAARASSAQACAGWEDRQAAECGFETLGLMHL